MVTVGDLISIGYLTQPISRKSSRVTTITAKRKGPQMPDIPAAAIKGQQVKSIFEWAMDYMEREPGVMDEIRMRWPKRHQQVCFEAITKEFQPTVKEVINRLGGDERGLACLGDVGVGKTCILRVAQLFVMLCLGGPYRCEGRVHFVNHFELVRELREYHDGRQGDGSGRTPLPYYVRYLFVDELGGYEDKSGWNLALSEDLFNHRYEHCLTTFIATNKTKDELRAWPGWSRIIDRLGDPSWMEVISMGEGSRRK